MGKGGYTNQDQFLRRFFNERDNLPPGKKMPLTDKLVAQVKERLGIEVPPDLLGPEQQEHENCGPFYFSVVLEEKNLRFEFLVRSADNMHCSCIAWATRAQRQFVLDFADRLMEEEMIKA